MATDILTLKNDFEDQATIADEWLNAVSDELELTETRLGELFGTGVLGASALNLTIVSAQIALEISSGYAIVGDAGERRLVKIEGPIIIDSDQGLGASNTYYVFLLREPTDTEDAATQFTANTTGTAPADSILIGSAVFDASEATSVDQLPQGRINLRNPVVLSGLAADRPTFGVAGRFWFSTDTAGGTLYYDTGSAWQQAAGSASAVRSGTDSPAQITSDQNNYAIGSARYQRLSTDASRTITGIVATTDGDEIVIVNVGSQNLVLSNENASSTAANRIVFATGAATLTLGQNKAATLVYDGTSARWRVTSTTGS